MSNLKTMLKWEFLLQSRYKIIHISILSVILSFLSTQALPAIASEEFHVLLLFFDSALVGIMFIGALVLFEKSENTLQALVVTPMSTDDYLLSKIISLTILSVVSALIFMSLNLVFNGTGFNIMLLILGIVLTSVMLILIGFILVSRVNSINEYLLSMMMAFIGLSFPPLLHLSGIYENVMFYLWPTQASLILIGGVFEEIETWELAYSIIYMVIFIGVLFFYAKKSFYKHIIMKGG
ncbi:MAG: ABC transporter permease [Candidatus Thermoplasmatota archaeon]|nr:ABC transporter permease [Candidatus Thermoplasmatota archaeon]